MLKAEPSTYCDFRQAAKGKQADEQPSGSMPQLPPA